MTRSYAFLIALTLISLSVEAAPSHGEIRETGDDIRVWHSDAEDWITPDAFFTIELTQLNGPTYGTVSAYPPYDEVREWDTLIDRLPDGRVCPMVFFHERWRRLPDVLALDERLRNHDGCRDVFRF